MRLVGETEVTITLKTSDLDPTGDLQADAGRVPALMGLVVELLSETTESFTLNDTAYRSWKANIGEKLLLEDPKIAEWKVSEAATARKEFKSFKQRQAELEGDLEYLRGYMEALRTMSLMIRVRAELTRKSNTGDEPDARPERDSKVRSAMRRGRED